MWLKVGINPSEFIEVTYSCWIICERLFVCLFFCFRTRARYWSSVHRTNLKINCTYRYARDISIYIRALVCTHWEIYTTPHAYPHTRTQARTHSHIHTQTCVHSSEMYGNSNISLFLLCWNILRWLKTDMLLWASFSHKKLPFSFFIFYA